MIVNRIKFRKYIKTIAAFTIAAIFAILVGQWYIEDKIEAFLPKELPDGYELSYENLDVNLLLRKVQLTNIDGLYKSTSNANENTKITIERLTLNGIGVFKLLSSGEIVIDEISIKNMDLVHRKASNKELSKKQYTKADQELRYIKIGKFNIENGSAQIIELDTDTEEFTIKDLGFELSKISIELTEGSKLNSLKYQKISLSGNAINIDLGIYESLKIGGLALSENELAARDIHLESKHSKQELSKVLEKQRDHINLNVPEIVFSDLVLSYKANEFGIIGGEIVIERPGLELFRDKLLPDDLSNKIWYGCLLEELPFQLHLSQINVNDGYVSYSELVNISEKAGEIAFSELNALLSNISTRNREQIDIDATAKINEEAPIELNLKFEKDKDNPLFTASGILQNFDAKSVNSYLESNLNAKAEGRIKELYFTISGNDVASSGEMKMKYENFSFVIMKNKGTGINKLLTAIGNIFTKSDSKGTRQEYRYGIVEAKRDTTKSFFNYLWSNVKNGIIETITGNGEKET